MENMSFQSCHFLLLLKWFFSLVLPSNCKDCGGDWHDDNNQEQVIICTVIPCILLVAAISTFYVMLKRQLKHRRQEQDQIEAYNVSYATNDNVVAYLDQQKSSSKEVF